MGDSESIEKVSFSYYGWDGEFYNTFGRQLNTQNEDHLRYSLTQCVFPVSD